jgi:sugar lactone lactonase YvrE
LADEEDKPDDFTPEGEARGYISLDQAKVLAMRVARDEPGVYGKVRMAFLVAEAVETEDYYVVTLSFRPEGDFVGSPGREQFYIEKEGAVAIRQVLGRPRREGRHFPLVRLAIGVEAMAGLGVVFVLGGGDDEAAPVVVGAPDNRPAVAPIRLPPTPVPTPAPAVAAVAAPQTQPTATPPPSPTSAAVLIPATATHTASPAPPTPTRTPTPVPPTATPILLTPTRTPSPTPVALAAAGTISTVAGIGTSGLSGDGGSATSAQVSFPFGIAVDSSGNLFIADRDNHRIRRVDTSGNISTVAGTGASGVSGDGAPATTAQLFEPTGVALDSSGNLFIADQNNHRIRRVDTSGNISTVAGHGTSGFSGDGSSATSAQLNFPHGVALDSSGNLFIADRDNHRIRKVDTSGNINTLAGAGTLGFSGDGGPATSAQLNFPYDIAVDSSGNLFIADRDNHRIRKVDTSGNISTVAGTGAFGFSGDGGPATGARLAGPTGVAVDSSGNLFVADRGNHHIRKVDTSGNISTVAGDGAQGFSGDGGPATSARLAGPTGVAVDSLGNLFITDRDNHRIRKVEAVAGP